MRLLIFSSSYSSRNFILWLRSCWFCERHFPSIWCAPLWNSSVYGCWICYSNSVGWNDGFFGILVLGACKVIQMPRSRHTSFQKNLHVSPKFSFSLFLTDSHTSRNQAKKHHQMCNHSNSQGADAWVGPRAYLYCNPLLVDSNDKYSYLHQGAWHMQRSIQCDKHFGKSHIEFMEHHCIVFFYKGIPHQKKQINFFPERDSKDRFLIEYFSGPSI